MAKKKRSAQSRAQDYYAFHDLPLHEIICAGEEAVPKEPPDEYYLSLGNETETTLFWLRRRRWSKRLVATQLVLACLSVVCFGAIFDISNCGLECPQWKRIAFFSSSALFVLSFFGSIAANCHKRIAQSKLDQLHLQHSAENSSESSVSGREERRTDGMALPATGRLV